MKPLLIIGSALLVALGGGCGGGGSPSPPSGPSAPSAPIPGPTTATLYPSVEEPASISTVYPHWADFVDPFPPHKVLTVGWNYFNLAYPPYDRNWSGFAAALKFDVAGSAGRTVTKARLKLYVTSARRDPNIAPPIKLNAFAANWDANTLSWNVLQGIACHTSGESQAATPSATGPLEWDVTTMVRNWASGAWNNYGLRISVDRYPDPGYESWASIGLCATAGVGNVLLPDCERPLLIVDYQ